MNVNGPAMLNKTQAASIIGVSVGTLNQMISNGLIDTVTINDRKYVTRSSVSELLSHTSNPRNLNRVLQQIERQLEALCYLVAEIAGENRKESEQVSA
jgi:hypothetical protein